MNVKWRDRRFYDIPLTWTRHGIETLFIGLFTANARPRYRSPRTIQSHMRVEAIEAQTGSRTATSFWRCPECKQHGEVYEASKRHRRVEHRTRPPNS